MSQQCVTIFAQHHTSIEDNAGVFVKQTVPFPFDSKGLSLYPS